MRRIFYSILIMSSAIALFPVSLSCRESSADKWSRCLNVIVLESMDLKSGIPKGGYKIQDLSSAELPLRLSSAYFPLSFPLKFKTGDLGLPGDLSLLDINTFRFSKEHVGKSRRVKRENAIVGLSYFFKVRNRTEDSWDIEFSGAYRESLPKVIGQLSIKTTTIVRIERLCFAFTFIEAAIKADGEMSSIEKQYPDSIAPKIIKEKIPEYPSELREARREGVFSFLGIITGQGTVDRSHGIILECSHWLFLRNALATMFNDWQFTPGQSGGKAVETIRELSWPFLLRHQVVNPIKTWRREYQ